VVWHEEHALVTNCVPATWLAAMWLGTDPPSVAVLFQSAVWQL
jgi:hypothetical protein